MMPFTSNVKNPWSVKSIYEFQFFNCPSCVYKINSKQAFINHAYEIHPEAIDDLNNVQDGSLIDVICPWEDIKKEEVDAIDDFDAVNDNIAEEEDWETGKCFQDDGEALEPAPKEKRTPKAAIKQDDVTCFICLKSFHSIGNFKRHNLKTHGDPRPFKCQLCNKTFTQKSYLICHELTHKNIENIKEESTFFSKINNTEESNFENIECKVDIKSEETLWKRGGIKAWPCMYCEKILKGRAKLKEHYEKCHPDIHYLPGRRGGARIKAWPCKYCDELCEGKTKLKDHIDKFHSDVHYATQDGPGRPRGSYKIKELIPENTIPKARNPDDPYEWKCEECSKTFKYHSKLLSTIQIYYAQILLQC